MNGERKKPKASVLDKTDWRKTIHKSLEHCVNTIGNIEFPKAVKSLISCVSARFPGFNAEALIERWMELTQKCYELRKAIWLTNNQTAHIWDKKIRYAEFVIQRDEEVFVYIKNLLAEKRILLYGIKERKEDSDELPDEEE